MATAACLFEVRGKVQYYVIVPAKRAHLEQRIIFELGTPRQSPHSKQVNEVDLKVLRKRYNIIKVNAKREVY